MRRQVIKSISIFMICIFVLFATFSACSNDPYSRFDYNVTSFDHIESDVFKANTDIPQRIDSVEQLKEFCNDTGMPINDKSNRNYDSDIYIKLRSYNNRYFKSNSLIIVFIGKPHRQELEFANLKIIDDTLIINILNEYDPYDEGVEYPTVADDHLMLIEINKNLISKVKQIIIKEYNHLI